MKEITYRFKVANYEQAVLQVNELQEVHKDMVVDNASYAKDWRVNDGYEMYVVFTKPENEQPVVLE